jgi:hypothetical protein
MDSILTFVSPFPLVKVFIDAFTVLLRGSAWLGRPSLNIGVDGFSLGFWVTYISTLLQAGKYVQYIKLEKSHTMHP